MEELEADNARMKKEMDSGKAEQRKKVSALGMIWNDQPKSEAAVTAGVVATWCI